MNLIKKDLHDRFTEELFTRYPKKADLVNMVSDILKIEKEAAYRRVSGKVNFSLREAGIMANVLSISLDGLLNRSSSIKWLPLVLGRPMRFESIELLLDQIERIITTSLEITKSNQAEKGAVYSVLPLEFYLHFPMLLKFMFYKWGCYFIKSQQYNKMSDWNLPARVNNLLSKHERFLNFKKAFYVWDSSLIWMLAREIENFHLMRAITNEEKDEIKKELRTLLSGIEGSLNGVSVPGFYIPPEIEFYVSSVNMGFTCAYAESPQRHISVYHTNFSYSCIENPKESFNSIKDWALSFAHISTLLSGSGRVERRVFFEKQYEIVDQI